MAEKPPEREIREFASFLVDLPSAHTKASKLLNELIGIVRDTGKPGTITLTVKVQTGKSNDRILEVLPDVKMTPPKVPLRGGIFYPDADNNPRREDPTIRPLFDDVDIRTATVDPATGEVKEARETR